MLWQVPETLEWRLRLELGRAGQTEYGERTKKMGLDELKRTHLASFVLNSVVHVHICPGISTGTRYGARPTWRPFAQATMMEDGR